MARPRTTPARSTGPRRATPDSARAAPPPFVRTTSDADDGTAAIREALDVSGARAVFVECQRQLQAHAPSAGAIGFWRSLISDAKACSDGQRVASDRVLSDAMDVFKGMVPVLLEGELPGYGPRRAYYALGLCLDLDSAYRDLRVLHADKAAAAQSKSDALGGAKQRRSTLEHILSETTRGRSDQQAALARITGMLAGRKPLQLAAGLETMADMAKNMLAEARHDPTLDEVYTDMGLTAAVETSARAEARQVVDARGAHGDHKAATLESSDELNTLDGRVWFELLALKSAAEVARSDGRKVPAVKLAQLERVRRAPATPTPTTIPTSGGTPPG